MTRADRLALALPILVLLGTTYATGAEWKAGVAQVAITPAQALRLAGYASRKKPASGRIHDLRAKALVIEDRSQTRLVVITLDLIAIPRRLATKVATQVEARFSLPRASLLFNASHTHCGPEVRLDRGEFLGLPAPEVEKIAAYRPRLEGQLVELIASALKDLSPAVLENARGRATFARNRRFPTPQGFVNRRYDDGPVDHDVPVLRVTDPNGTPRAILFGYACHNTTLSFHQWCGDYAGFAQIDLEEKFPNAVALFVTGCGGDQNPYPRRTLDLARQHGRSLADAVTTALEHPERVRPPLRVAFGEATLDFKPLPARDVLERSLHATNVYEQRKAKYLLHQLDTDEGVRTTYPVPVQAARFGDDLLLIALGGEAVVDYAHRIKKELAAHARQVWAAGYSNDVFGYLPSLRVLKEGGYEAEGATLYGPLPGPFTETVEERVLTVVRQLVDTLW